MNKLYSYKKNVKGSVGPSREINFKNNLFFLNHLMYLVDMYTPILKYRILDRCKKMRKGSWASGGKFILKSKK